MTAIAPACWLSSAIATPRAWNEGEHHRAVAGVLGDLAPARLAFLAQLLQLRLHHAVSSCMMMDAEMYGMMPSAKISCAPARRPRTC